MTISCLVVGPRIRAPDAPTGNAEQQFQEWSTVATLPTGRVHVSAMPISNQGREQGFAILVHDLSYIQRREAAARTFLIVVFGILAEPGISAHSQRHARTGRANGQ